MTCREKLAIEYPDKVDPEYTGGCAGCPEDYGYLDDPRYCYGFSESRNQVCTNCWDREIPETTNENKKENDTMPIHAVREMTAAELLQKAKDYQKLAEIEKMKEQTQEAASALKAVMDGLVAAGFTEDQAFTIMHSMMNIVIGKL